MLGRTTVATRAAVIMSASLSASSSEVSLALALFRQRMSALIAGSSSMSSTVNGVVVVGIVLTLVSRRRGEKPYASPSIGSERLRGDRKITERSVQVVHNDRAEHLREVDGDDSRAGRGALHPVGTRSTFLGNRVNTFRAKYA